MQIQARIISALLAISLSAVGVMAQETRVGRETGFPIPRYVSIKASEAFLRRGPSSEHRIDWVYHRKAYPVRVIGESGHWRKIEDVDGVQGWFNYTLLSGTRTVLVQADKISMRKTAAENSQIVAILEKGVIANLEACSENWCKIEIQKIKGWVPKSAIWGVDANEVFEE